MVEPFLQTYISGHGCAHVQNKVINQGVAGNTSEYIWAS